MFPDFYVLGWYSTGSDAEESDMLIHKAVSFQSVFVGLRFDLNVLKSAWLSCRDS